jgi:small subunit ribosomal protein S1
MPSSPEIVELPGAAEAPEAEVAPIESAAPEAANAATADVPACETPASEVSSQGEKKPRAARGDARARRKAKPARSPRARSEEFVAPTPEELAGVVSAGVRQAIEASLPVNGQVIGWNQGGFHVVVDGISAFCPRSSMELGSPHEPAQYLDQTYLFRILRVEEKGKRLVLSRAAVMLEEKRHAIEEAKKKLQVGVTLSGKVVSLTDFGAFVDLGGVEGLLHVSEIGHKRLAHPSEALAVGQEIEVKVIKLGGGKGERASLSMRALAPDPWEAVAEKWPAGGKFTGKIVRKSDFGWFVELGDGIEGLLHPSQLAPGMNEKDPRLAPGETIEGWVREVEAGRHRISLALREVPTGNPWQGVEKKYAEGEVVIGTVEKIAPFGAFIVLEPGLSGLLPTSEMGLPRGASVGKAYPVGKQISLKVAEVDARRKRISLTRQDKTLEGSKADYQAFVKKTRKNEGMGTLAAAFERLKG